MQLTYFGWTSHPQDGHSSAWAVWLLDYSIFLRARTHHGPSLGPTVGCPHWFPGISLSKSLGCSPSCLVVSFLGTVPSSRNMLTCGLVLAWRLHGCGIYENIWLYEQYNNIWNGTEMAKGEANPKDSSRLNKNWHNQVTKHLKHNQSP